MTGTLYAPAHWLGALDDSAEENNLTRNELIAQLLLYAKRKERSCQAPPDDDVADAVATSARLPKKWWVEFDDIGKKTGESRADIIKRLLWAGMLAHGIQPRRTKK